MEKTLRVINQMQSDGILKKYAVAGGIAAIFYVEPFATFDLDIFVVLPEENNILVSLSPIYEWLKEKGYKPGKEYIIIEDIPVQFIPAYNELVKEAVINALARNYKKTPVFVLQKEYLLAIMLQTNRPKDIARMIKFFDETEVSDNLLKKILVKHNLENAFEEFKRKYDISEKH
ncbi:MAG: hypothetical protein AB1498_11560 [bacterium]